MQGIAGIFCYTDLQFAFFGGTGQRQSLLLRAFVCIHQGIDSSDEIRNVFVARMIKAVAHGKHQREMSDLRAFGNVKLDSLREF